MSDNQQDNAARIAAYLENKLSPEAREAFKRSLSEDDDLRLQYVEALMNRGGKGESGAAAPGATGGKEGVDKTHGFGVGMEEQVSETHGTGDEVRESEAAALGGLEDHAAAAAVYDDPTAGEHEREDVGGEADIREGEVETDEDVEVVRVRRKRDVLGRAWVAGMAALLVIIAGVGIYLLMDHENHWSKAAGGTGTDTAKVAGTGANPGAAVSAAADSLKAGQSGAPAGNAAASNGSGAGSVRPALADSLYARFYKPYGRGNDPMELKKYYQEYRAGNYSAIVEKGDSPALGVGQRAILIRDYMRLYVGLSYLATGDARSAVTELEGVVLRTKPGDVLYETAKWYLVLAWLKRNDMDPVEAQGRAVGLAREISRGYSRYQEPAKELLTYFSGS